MILISLTIKNIFCEKILHKKYNCVILYIKINNEGITKQEETK